VTLPDWPDDPGRRERVAYRCTVCEDEGTAECITQDGATDYSPEECPVCGGELDYGE